MKRVHNILAGAADTLALIAITAFAAAPGGTPAPSGAPCGAAGFSLMGMMYGGGGPGAMAQWVRAAMWACGAVAQVSCPRRTWRTSRASW